MRKGLLIRYRRQDGRPIGHWPGRRWGRLWIQGQSSRDPRESQSLSGDLVGSGLVARGLSWDERSLLAFFLDAQPDLTPSPPARSQQACPLRGFTDLRGHGSRSLRQGSPGLLLQCPSSTRAHASTRGERRLTGPRRLCAVPSCLSILGPARRPRPWRCWRAGSRASCSGTAN